jgi:hypothetical protein
MLLFQKRFLSGIVSGDITVTFRQWPKLRVKPGGRYRAHPIGVVEVTDVARVQVKDISAAEARRAGFESLDELLEYLQPAAKGAFGRETELYRIELRYGGDGDWVPISRESNLTDDDVQEIERRLARLDKKEPWTYATLDVIDRHPRVAAGKLASELGREKVEFKADVVKLKKLGLTQSFEVGYELSPRGRAYWDKVKRTRRPK